MAPINANGTLGAWTATTSFASGRRLHASVAYNGFLYILGGSDLYDLSDVQVAPINANATLGATPGSWTATTSLPGARFGHTTVAHNGFVYLLGGSTGDARFLNDAQMAPINANGTLGAWTAAPSFPTPRGNFTSVAYNGHLYVLGGYNRNPDNTLNVFNEVLVAPINPNGTSGTWTATTSFPTARFGHASVVHDGSLYVVGGAGVGGYLNDVQMAPIKPNGTLGEWTATTSLPTALYGPASVAYNDSLFVVGGLGDAGYQNDVQVAPINPNGTLGAWMPTTSLPTAPRYGHSALAYNGALYVLGGGLGGEQVAPINSNGTLGAWTVASLPKAQNGHSSLVYRGYLYIFGGAGGGDGINVVQFAPILGPVALGSYSRLVDVGAVALLDSVTLNGSRANRGDARVSYRAAPASGVFGSLVDKGVVPLGQPVDLGGTSARYLWVRLTLDDTGTVTANPNPATERDVTDLTLTYSRPIGDLCATAADCGSGNCVDGVCCNTACGAPCDACNLPGSVGTCSNLPARSAGSPSCAPSVCSGTAPGCPVIKPCGCSTGAPGLAAAVLMAVFAGISVCRRSRARQSRTI